MMIHKIHKKQQKIKLTFGWRTGVTHFTGRHIGGDTHITSDMNGDTHITSDMTGIHTSLWHRDMWYPHTHITISGEFTSSWAAMPYHVNTCQGETRNHCDNGDSHISDTATKRAPKQLFNVPSNMSPRFSLWCKREKSWVTSLQVKRLYLILREKNLVKKNNDKII